MQKIDSLIPVILFAPLVGAMIAGFLGRRIGRNLSHSVTIILVGLSFLLSLYVFKVIGFGPVSSDHIFLFNWGNVGTIHFDIGLLIDPLTVYMMVIVTFVSLLVHIYSIGYMADEDGYCRFFSYISGFTFAMLALVMSDNFLLLYFGWEGVGLFSYLLIGFWFHREKSNFASIKAFLVNRVGDLGMLLGLALVLIYFHSLSYQVVFSKMSALVASTPHVSILGYYSVSGIGLMCFLLLLGALGKSAQIPLHVWLEGSMEGPTPISALIHAATMVTAGVFMLARLSPMFEYSAWTLSVVLILGALTCFLMGLIGIVQQDIKRVVAYSTLSQLGYMMAAQGASAYPIGMFHLMTHAAFKALLFLACGSVVLAMHHSQDLRKMGGIGRKMPVTYICFLIGAMALAGLPPFAGYFSKDLIIDAVHLSNLPGAQFAYYLVLGGVFVTGMYTFRVFILVFHGPSRAEPEVYKQVKESPWVVLIPLIALSIPALLAGWVFVEPILQGFFKSSIFILPQHNHLADLSAIVVNPLHFVLNSISSPAFWLAIAALLTSIVFYGLRPQWPDLLVKRFSWCYRLLVNKYGFDVLFDRILGVGSIRLGQLIWKYGDVMVVDKTMVEGTAKSTLMSGRRIAKLQSGFLNHYVLWMLIALVCGFVWYVTTILL